MPTTIRVPTYASSYVTGVPVVNTRLGTNGQGMNGYCSGSMTIGSSGTLAGGGEMVSFGVEGAIETGGWSLVISAYGLAVMALGGTGAAGAMGYGPLSCKR
jgi:hypothetical protein